MSYAVIFDMDGVVIDSEPIHQRVFQEIAAKRGITLPPGALAAYIGRSPIVQWTDLKNTYQLDERPEDIAAEQMDRYLAVLAEIRPGPMPGLSSLLTYLTNEGVLMALASSNTRKVVDAVPDMLGIGQFFSQRISGQDVTHAKPAPDVFLAAAQKLNVPAPRCIVVEDATNGVKAAKAAGMRCAGLQIPGTGDQDLSLADIIVPSLVELEHAFATGLWWS
ncbi:HAD family hydrolase [Desulfovibrio inopinatus]|uniref:HAD family hydrolase n=1 Tax=Desulfovibrio inopinatus TaxID=102109 RepID=UPI0003F86E8B|nr:HAD family phosphatase [Desulfovibrio inopinatus]